MVSAHPGRYPVLYAGLRPAAAAGGGCRFRVRAAERERRGERQVAPLPGRDRLDIRPAAADPVDLDVDQGPPDQYEPLAAAGL